MTAFFLNLVSFKTTILSFESKATYQFYFHILY